MTTHVYYSEKFNNRCGNSILTDVDGRKISFSFTSETKDTSSYNYDDIVYLGEYEIVTIEKCKVRCIDWYKKDRSTVQMLPSSMRHEEKRLSTAKRRRRRKK